TYETEWTEWAETFTTILRNWARTIIAWNITLDEKGHPNIGPFPCGGMFTVQSSTRAIVYSRLYHAMQHFARQIRRGAKTLRPTGEIASIHHVAARNPDRSFAVVLTNTETAPRRVTLTVSGSAVALDLAADSVTTLAWT